MRKILSIFALLLSFTTIALAQPNSNTGPNVSKVNIILREFQTVVVKQGDEVVDLVYDTFEKYRDGVSVTKENHLTVFSTNDFEINSAVWQENLIYQQDIFINDVPQSRSFSKVHEGTAGVRDISITYRARGDYDYLTKEKKTYTTQVIYTINPK